MRPSWSAAVLRGSRADISPTRMAPLAAVQDIRHSWRSQWTGLSDPSRSHSSLAANSAARAANGGQPPNLGPGVR